jgi:hypothetical protein
VAQRLASALAPSRILPTQADRILASIAAGLLVIALIATLL